MIVMFRMVRCYFTCVVHEVGIMGFLKLARGFQLLKLHSESEGSQLSGLYVAELLLLNSAAHIFNR